MGEAHVGESLEHARRRTRQDLAPAVHHEVPADRGANDEPGERNDGVIERLQERQQQLWLGFDFGHEFPSAIFRRA
jgi:hypothetical protein